MAYSMLSEADRVAQALEDLVKIHPEARSTFEFGISYDWALDPYAGGIGPLFRPHELIGQFYDDIVRPVGRVWFANDACDQRGRRWIEGAIAAATKNAFAIHTGMRNEIPGRDRVVSRPAPRGWWWRPGCPIRGRPGSRRDTASSAHRRSGSVLPTGRCPPGGRSAAPGANIANAPRAQRSAYQACEAPTSYSSRMRGWMRRHVVERLLEPRLLVHRAPLQGVLAPGVAREQDAARRRRVGRRVVHPADRQLGHGAAAVDPVVLLPEPVADLEQDLGRGVVVELADRPLLRRRERLEDLDRAQHRERDGHDDVVAARSLNRPDSVLKWTVTPSGSWSMANTLAPNRTSSAELGVERVRQTVHPADDLLHVDVRAAEVLAQDLDERVVLVGLEEVDDRVVLDGAARPALVARGTRTASTGRTRGRCAPRRRRPSLSTIARRSPMVDSHSSSAFRPRSCVSTRERQPARVAIGLLLRHPHAADVDERLRIAHHERPHRQPEQVAVACRVRSCARGMRMPPASAYRPGANVRSV